MASASGAGGRSVALSKKLSWLLRHGAANSGLELDSEGFLEVDSVLALPTFAAFCLADIEKVVAENNKKRFSLKTSDGKLLIRANQGHTLPVENLGRFGVGSQVFCKLS